LNSANPAEVADAFRLSLPNLEPPAFFAQVPNREARPERRTFLLLPFLQLLDDLFHGLSYSILDPYNFK
jgi:hypothetical protein